MSHLRPDDRPQRHRKSECRKGRHAFGEAQNVGGGITRQVCAVCSVITIDLTGADGLTSPLVQTHARLRAMRASLPERP